MTNYRTLNLIKQGEKLGFSDFTLEQLEGRKFKVKSSTEEKILDVPITSNLNMGKIHTKLSYDTLRFKIDNKEFFLELHDDGQIEDEEAKLKQELEQAGNDIFDLVEQRAKITDDRTEKLRTESD